MLVAVLVAFVQRHKLLGPGQQTPSPVVNSHLAFLSTLGSTTPKYSPLESHSSFRNSFVATTHNLESTRSSKFKHGRYGFKKTSNPEGHGPGKKQTTPKARMHQQMTPPPGSKLPDVRSYRLLGQEKPEKLSEVSSEKLSFTLRLKHLLEGGLGSALLIVAAVISMCLANCQKTQVGWLAFWARRAGPPLIYGEALSLLDWVNEGLMALFFFSVGLEIKKELTEGALASRQKALLPCIAALGGMIVPMLVYLVVGTFLPGAHMGGATIPMATDIAFAMGVFSLFRHIMPQSAQSFLLALATVDDLGAIVVIAIFFGHGLRPGFLEAASACLLCTAYAGNKGWIKSLWWFIAPGLLLWFCLLEGGINSDIAGVLTAFCIPLSSARGNKNIQKLMDHWATVAGAAILPIFALANCAVPVGEALPHTFAGCVACSAVPVGVLLGLLIGKPIGIFLFSWLSVRLGFASMPPKMTNRDLATIGVLGGIGFTMCLFLIENSLHGHTAELAILAVFAASGLAATIGACLMKWRPGQRKRIAA